MIKKTGKYTKNRITTCKVSGNNEIKFINSRLSNLSDDGSRAIIMQRMHGAVSVTDSIVKTDQVVFTLCVACGFNIWADHATNDLYLNNPRLYRASGWSVLSQ